MKAPVRLRDVLHLNFEKKSFQLSLTIDERLYAFCEDSPGEILEHVKAFFRELVQKNKMEIKTRLKEDIFCIVPS